LAQALAKLVITVKQYIGALFVSFASLQVRLCIGAHFAFLTMAK